MRQLLGGLTGAQRLLREAWHASRAPAGDLAAAAVAATATQQVIPLRLCDTDIALVVDVFGRGGPVFVNLHENESTSVAAARAVLQGRSGRLVRLRAKGRRYVVFWNGRRPHAFDPNRVFTDAGIEQTLRRYASFSAPAVEALRQFRQAVLSLLAPAAGEPVVALHNNAGTDYSVLAYRPGGRHAGDAAAAAAPRPGAPEDFFLVTDEAWFHHLERSGFNVVLQSQAAQDDGSLSVAFKQSAVPYINVEARHGRQREQTAMLLAVADGLQR